ncbi:DUF3299 domain-containing protein [Motiliproteus coralliicola]|uniref:DUF3299 domain-containing protein n=1 Tax=Motiliproteus coralliicola TaxID=2283196 RepID=A0A369WLY1_9GAMM|nr:DUF3299 domain-containing protein [Motiliproteus coralliicola]RDE22471.1 DUF3299 domain-containing protein [Motiliproteus coralliicola]
MKVSSGLAKCLITAGVLLSTLLPSLSYAVDEVRALDWNDLMPAGFSDEALFADYDVSSFDDGDPEGQRRYEEFQEILQSAPVIESLDGQLISLPGFALPLEGDYEATSLFLLVPYFGACIHVPPPPSNQIVLVRADPGVKIETLFAPVKVSGRIRIESTDTGIAHAGYTMDLTNIETIEDF